MMLPLLLVLALDGTQITAPMSLTRSTNILPGEYVVEDKDGKGVIQVDADNVVIDFHGASLRSQKDIPGEDQDKYAGTGIAINGHKNVTIKNATIRGFRNNLLAVASTKLKIENCDFSYSEAQRIWKNGSPVDLFLELRNPEAWREYGAGIWLENCSQSTITKCRAQQAQNGLVLFNSKGCLVHDNDFSFNSGWGIAMTGSTENTVSWNRADFVNRPWGGGYGGDSAALAMANGCSKNFIVGNSLTHSGDGFFLSDRYNGRFDPTQNAFIGCSNDNVIAYNDGSWSPNNAFEATFSDRNCFYQNISDDSRYGFWLGYSRDTTVLNNEVQRNLVDGLAWEHGQGAWVQGNNFDRNHDVAVHLWGDAKQATPSNNIVVAGNSIRNSKLSISLEYSSNWHVADNQISGARLGEGVVPEPAGSLSNYVNGFEGSKAYKQMMACYGSRPRGFVFYRDQAEWPKGAEWVQFGSFAPRPFENQSIAWRQIADNAAEFHTLGTGTIRFDKPDWVTIEKDSNSTYSVKAQPLPDGAGRYESATIGVDGPFKQTIQIPFFATNWHVRWYQWDKNTLKINDPAGWDALYASKPLKETDQAMINADYSFHEPTPGIRTEYWAFEAKTLLKLAKGHYVVKTLADDGIRVFVDDKEVVSGWKETPGNQSGEIDLAEGVHTIRVRFMQTWGNTYLFLSLAAGAVSGKQ